MIGDNEEQLQIATEIFTKVEDGEIEVEILDSVLMEALFVLIKFYKLPKSEVIEDLKRLMKHQTIHGLRRELRERQGFVESMV